MRFEPGNFESILGYHNELADKVAAHANALLAKWLDAAPESDADFDPRWDEKQIHEQWEKGYDGRKWRFKLVAVEEVPR